MPTITPIGASFGAVITDIKLADMDTGEWLVVEGAFHEYAALVFPDQHLSEDEQIAFAERFGNMELLRPDPTKKAVPISNLKADGTPYSKDEARFRTLRGNEGWHTDSSYMPLAAKASILAAIQVPSAGGETELADMRDAYDKLDDETKGKIEGLTTGRQKRRFVGWIGILGSLNKGNTRIILYISTATHVESEPLICRASARRPETKIDKPSGSGCKFCQ